MHLLAGPRGDGAGASSPTFSSHSTEARSARTSTFASACPRRYFRGTSSRVLKTALKDITPATELAEEVGVQVQLAEACRAEMNEALERGLGGLDSSVALTLQEERAGVQVRLA